MSQEKVVENVVEAEATESNVESVTEAIVESTTESTIEVTVVTTVEATTSKVTKITAELAPATVTEQKPTKEEFEGLLNDGKKAFLLQNYSVAVEKLSRAAVLSVELFGDFAAETFSPHYYYGKTLFELTSMERELMETKFDDDKFANDPIIGEFKEGIKQIMEAQANLAPTQEMEVVNEEANAEVNAEDEPTNNDEEIADETADQQDIDIDQTAGDDENDEDEEVENGQLAFESLDYARITCVKNADGSPEWLERQKDTLILLGQLALSEDQFETAIEDLKSALEIVDKNFDEDYREVAFINMELARVYRKTNDYATSNLHTDNAIRSLEQFKAKLVAEPQNDNAKLLAEIQGLIDEVLDERNVTRVRECEEKENAAVREPVTTDEKPSEDLVIKRKEKRPADDQPDFDEAKKSKVDGVLSEVSADS